jgi:hypothetical protein
VLPNGAVRLVAAILPWVVAVGLLLVLGLFVRFAGMRRDLGALFVVALVQAKAGACRSTAGASAGQGRRRRELVGHRAGPSDRAVRNTSRCDQWPWQLDDDSS